MTPASALPRLGAPRAMVLVFAASFATLVVELVADRLLAPFVGASLHTWTSIIGVVLAGISVGSWVGGRVADRRPDLWVVAALLAVGAGASLLSLGLARALGDGGALRALPVLPRTFLLSLLGFFPMSFVLAMVTPTTLKLALPSLQRAGRTAGLLYAVGTVGSIAGSLVTGFVLVARFPVPTILLTVAGALLLTALVVALPARVTLPPAPATPPAPAPGQALAPRGTDWLELRGGSSFAVVLVACASFCTMAVELSASRFLAPHLGVSLYSWTGIISVVLAGIALGNLVGGQVADRWPRQEVLAGSLLLAGLCCLTLPMVHRVLLALRPFQDMGLMASVVLFTACNFLLPVAALGTLSPQVLKLALSDMDQAGRTAGRLYAWSTAGALAGTFLTGWVLISWMGVHLLVACAGLALVALAAVAGRAWRRPRFFAAVAGTLALAGVLGAGRVYSSLCTVETDYFCIRVEQMDYRGQPVKVLGLDHLVHTRTRLEDPGFLGYPHMEVQSDFVRRAAARSPQPRVLVIGGGGYALPRWIEAHLPQTHTEVVEIDPAVTRIALEQFGVAPDTRIVSYNLDGRQFIQEQAERGAYDVVIQDAVNDMSVPYHLMTREYNAHVRALLKPDAVYLLTLIDDVPDGGTFLRSAVATLRQTFPEVKLLLSTDSHPSGNQPYVLAASLGPLDVEGLEALIRQQGGPGSHTVQVPDAVLASLMASGPAIVLTDDYAPVDNILTELFVARQRHQARAPPSGLAGPPAP